MSAVAQNLPFPVIDTHIHLFDTAREGIPYPNKNNATLFKPALPERYRKIAAPLGVSGAIEVECSNRFEDNQWVLDTAGADKIMVGTVGNLEPGKPEFRKQLEGFHRNPLFLGIRYGNLWGRNFRAAVAQPDFIADVKFLAEAGLELDTANPNPALIADLVKLTDQVPNLRLIIDHLPQLPYPTEASAVAAYQADLRELGKRPHVYVKVSEVLRRVNGQVPTDLNFYRQRLDELWDVFGENRLLYGSDWPNCDTWAEYPVVFGLVREYFMAKGPVAAEKYFWKNSVAAYRWSKRDSSQPEPAKA